MAYLIWWCGRLAGCKLASSLMLHTDNGSSCIASSFGLTVGKREKEKKE